MEQLLAEMAVGEGNVRQRAGSLEEGYGFRSSSKSGKYSHDESQHSEKKSEEGWDFTSPSKSDEYSDDESQCSEKNSLCTYDEGGDWRSSYSDEDEYSYDNYMDDYILSELEQEIQRQVDEQFEEEQRKANDLLQRKLDEAIEHDARTFEMWQMQKRMLELEIEMEADLAPKSNSGIHNDDMGGLLQHVKLSKDDDVHVGVTVDDVDFAIQRAIRNFIETDEDHN